MSATVNIAELSSTEQASPQLRLLSIHELTEHPLNRAIYGDSQPNKKLLNSIRNVGVLSPIIVNQDRQILSGTRRWKALKILAADGGSSCVYTICNSQGTGLAGEQFLIEANRQREKTPEQIAREFTELKRIEGALAKQRQEIGNNQHRVKANLPEGSKGQARDLAAEKVGLKPRTAEKLEAIVRAADAETAAASAAVDEKHWISKENISLEPSKTHPGQIQATNVKFLGHTVARQVGEKAVGRE